MKKWFSKLFFDVLSVLITTSFAVLMLVLAYWVGIIEKCN